jgi:hypothetical protein
VTELRENPMVELIAEVGDRLAKLRTLNHMRADDPMAVVLVDDRAAEQADWRPDEF